MRIQIKKGKNTITLKFYAQTEREAVDLKNAVLAAAKKAPPFTPEAIITELGKLSYTVSDPGDAPA